MLITYTTDSAFTHYGEATKVVPLNGCADLYATFEAYYAEASADAEAGPYSSVNVSTPRTLTSHHTSWQPSM